jgi:inorganic triphosphatase YgiF
MAADVTETETKYDASPGTPLPRLDDLSQVASTVVPDEEQLDAEYFDTDDLRLVRAGITLRRRTGGEDAGWHLKLPAGPDTRREIRLPLGRAGRRVPADLARLVRAYTRGEPLRSVAQMSTRRKRVILLDHGGESLAEVSADDVRAQTMGDSTTLSQWQEVEVEPAARASPKSMIFTWPPGPSSRFSGLMSWCTRPAWCTTCRNASRTMRRFHHSRA